jgi:hypothetical protein
VLTSNGSTWSSSPPVVSGGTVTAVATGAGLTGGTITTSGTISLVTTADAVGTYALLYGGGALGFGATIGGGSLTPSSAFGNLGGGTRSGTWRCMGNSTYVSCCGVAAGNVTLYVRIA